MPDTMKVVNGLRFVMEEVHRGAMSMEDSKEMLDDLLTTFYREEREELRNTYRELVQKVADVEDAAEILRWRLENLAEDPEGGIGWKPVNTFNELYDIKEAVNNLEVSINKVDNAESEGQE